MKGIRAFGKNEGALNHVGDFVLLFSPLLPQLTDTAVFGPQLKFPFYWPEEDERKAEELMTELSGELDALTLRRPTEETAEAGEPFYGPGFFPRFAAYIEDDWNDLLCFKPPFPEYQALLKVTRSKEHQRAFKAKDFTPLRSLYRALQFFAYFRNIDACFWECYLRDEALVDVLERCLAEQRLEYERLDFDSDYPFGGLKQKRTFKDVHVIWPREEKSSLENS